MADLFGIFSNKELTDHQKMLWSRMCSAFSRSQKCRPIRRKISLSEIAVISYHKNDDANIINIDYDSNFIASIGIDKADIALNSYANSNALNFIDKKTYSLLKPPFALVQLFSATREIEIISDHFGQYPIYYAYNSNLLIFATKFNPILKSGLINWELDPEAIIDFMTYEQITGHKTYANSVKVLPPGSALRIKNGSLIIEPLFSISTNNSINNQISTEEVADKLYSELSRSVKDTLQNRKNVAITLSGGLDSRSLLGCALKYRANLKTYTFGTIDCRDVQYAKQISAACNVAHSWIPIDAGYLTRWLEHGVFITGGMVSCTFYHILHLADLLKNETDIVLDGLGGDFLTGANLKWKYFGMRSVDAVIEALYKYRASTYSTQSERIRLFDSDFINRTDYNPIESMQKHFMNLSDRNAWYGSQLFDFFERQRRLIQFGPHQLRHVVDVKTPFYSPNLVSFAMQLPARHLLNQRSYHRMHVKHFPSIAKFPDSKRGLPLSYPTTIRLAKHFFDFAQKKLPPLITNTVRHKKVSPLINYNEWFRNDLRSFIFDQLDAFKNNFQGIFQPKEISRIINSHMTCGENNTTKIGCLLTLNSWFNSLKGKP